MYHVELLFLYAYHINVGDVTLSRDNKLNCAFYFSLLSLYNALRDCIHNSGISNFCI